MGKVAKVTISLPADLLEFVERFRQERGETRSDVIRRALEDLRREEQEREDVERYIRAYREQPQTDDEFGWTDWMAAQALAEIPWEDEESETRGNMVGESSTASTVPLSPRNDGVPRACVISLDNILSVRNEWLETYITRLSPEKIEAIDSAIHFALGLRD